MATKADRYREFYVICSIFYFAVMGISKRITW